MGVVKKTMFETSDGGIFKVECDAINHERKLEILKVIQEFDVRNVAMFELSDLHDNFLAQLFDIGTKAYQILDTKK